MIHWARRHSAPGISGAGSARSPPQTGHGARSGQSETVDTYFQGMNGDYQSGGGSTSASLSTTIGGATISATDSNQWAGMDFEHAVYNGAGGSLVAATVSTPYSSAATATQTGMPSPLPNLSSYMVGTAESQTFTALASGGYREADEDYTHDSAGRVTVDEDVPVAYDNGAAGDASEDTCTQSTYPSSGTWDLTSEVIVTSEPPASCPVTRDSGSVGADLGHPVLLRRILDTWRRADAGKRHQDHLRDVLQRFVGRSSRPRTPVPFDEYGRLTSSTDADGNTTTTVLHARHRRRANVGDGDHAGDRERAERPGDNHDVRLAAGPAADRDQSSRRSDDGDL